MAANELRTINAHKKLWVSGRGILTIAKSKKDVNTHLPRIVASCFPIHLDSLKPVKQNKRTIRLVHLYVQNRYRDSRKPFRIQIKNCFK